MKKKITLQNLRDYIQGNTQMILDGLGLKEDYYLEQIAFRMSQCPDCWEKKTCKHCGCRLPGRWYTTKSCNNGERFPDLMNEQDWIKFKEQNGIK